MLFSSLGQIVFYKLAGIQAEANQRAAGVHYDNRARVSALPALYPALSLALPRKR